MPWYPAPIPCAFAFHLLVLKFCAGSAFKSGIVLLVYSMFSGGRMGGGGLFDQMPHACCSLLWGWGQASVRIQRGGQNVVHVLFAHIENRNTHFMYERNRESGEGHIAEIMISLFKPGPLRVVDRSPICRRDRAGVAIDPITCPQL